MWRLLSTTATRCPAGVSRRIALSVDPFALKVTLEQPQHFLSTIPTPNRLHPVRSLCCMTVEDSLQLFDEPCGASSRAPKAVV